MTDCREMLSQAELEALNALMGGSEEDLATAQKETAEYLSVLGTDELRFAGERVVSLYFKAENKAHQEAGGFASKHVDPFAHALLKKLEEFVGTPSEKEALDIAYRVVRGAAVAQENRNTHLGRVGMAAYCSFPLYLGQL